MHEFTIKADNFNNFSNIIFVFIGFYCAVREDYRTGHHKLRFLAIILLQNHAFSLKTLAVVCRKPYLQNLALGKKPSLKIEIHSMLSPKVEDLNPSSYAVVKL